MRPFVIHGEGLPMDAAFRRPWRRPADGRGLLSSSGGDLPIRRRSSSGCSVSSSSGGHLPDGLPMDAAFCHALKA